MTPSEYVELAMKTLGLNVRDTNTMLMNVGLGLAGESGEVADLVKKWAHHGHVWDQDKAELEVGDVLWYIAEFCEATHTTFETLFERNIAKLKARYPNGFESEKSINRET